MNAFSKDILQNLSEVHDTHCTSIYLPTRQTGADKKSMIQFKNQLQEVEKELEKRGLSDTETKEYLAAGRDLLEKVSFWSNLSQGLVVFMRPGEMRTYHLPVSVAQKTYIADHFYLLPLIPLAQEKERFFVLTLSQKDIDLYVCDSQEIKEIKIEDLSPQRLEEAVGWDYEQKSLQYRVGHSVSGGGAMFHGHGGGKEKEEEEMLQFCRAIDKGLQVALQGESAPLVVACVDHLFPIYKKANTYGNLYPENLSGNPDREPAQKVHERAHGLLKPHFQQEEAGKKDNFKELYASSQTSWDLEDIVSAAVQGKIDTLFLREEVDVYGLFDPKDHKLEVHQEKALANASLYNLAGLKTWRQGGKVYILPQEEMPLPDMEVSALYRYGIE